MFLRLYCLKMLRLVSYEFQGFHRLHACMEEVYLRLISNDMTLITAVYGRITVAHPRRQ
jgi:hypothetical protein